MWRRLRVRPRYCRHSRIPVLPPPAPWPTGKSLVLLGIHPTASEPTPQEAWESLVARITYLFSEKFLTSLHPLIGHLGGTLWRKGDLCGSIPVSVIAVYDTKLFNLCKCINPAVESNPLLVNLYIMRAATKLYEFLSTSVQHLWLKKKSPYPQDMTESLVMQTSIPECIQVSAAKIPSSMEKPIETVTLHVSAKEYYLDIIAKELGLEDASYVLISSFKNFLHSFQELHSKILVSA
ncbi:hypothetical protein QN277_025704 [Acacia crassicarpa]|uniref:Small RNA 2'-O-methyltransferase Hen1 La-motif C-terminal domain-containing protein n=1 Tax=Acacia crassicarpa TaxID=499986 RepID=A0AAE1K394_9FABA|nr:hypothetical protein QN277_025704 [Acacia crassicarpa]